jgi:hypothetical protein
MREIATIAVAAALIGGAMLLSASAPASATSIPAVALTAPGETALVEQVRRRGGDRARRYDSHRHGSRYRHASPRYRHFYGGYYYATPWWQGPAIGFGLTVPMSSAHVQWCLNRFRSYDPASDTYLGYDGFRHRCNSPYR